MFGIGAGEFVIILVAALILFGPSKLPEVGRVLGKALREFRKAQAALSASLEESAVTSEKKSAVETPPTAENKVTVDDVINLAKKNPIAEENTHEKNSAAVDNVSVADNSASNPVARGDTDSIKK